jgi:hypothetical protein
MEIGIRVESKNIQTGSAPPREQLLLIMDAVDAGGTPVWLPPLELDAELTVSNPEIGRAHV